MPEPVNATHKHVRFNAIVNILDGAFFGSALGFASFTTIIPLFVSQLTDSAILIGLAVAFLIGAKFLLAYMERLAVREGRLTDSRR